MLKNDRVAPLEDGHLDDAADLVARNYSLLRGLVPELPERYENSDSVLPMIRDTAEQNPGVVALAGGRVVGFLVATVLPSFRGRRAAFSPEWAHAAERERAREMYQRMYAALSSAWVAQGCTAHLITMPADDAAGADAWFWQGFGLVAVDALRDLRRAPGAETDCEVNPAAPADVGALLEFAGRLRDHLESPPAFLQRALLPDRKHWETVIADPDVCIQLARHAGRAVGFMKIGPASHGACQVIRDEKTASITAAFTEPPVRGNGVGTALLNRCVEWARARGCARCSVDFEPMNIEGSCFWLRHFHPVCLSVMRVVDERTL